jgi:hypothetical protein
MYVTNVYITHTHAGAGHTGVVQLLLEAARNNMRVATSTPQKEDKDRNRITDGTCHADVIQSDPLAIFLPDKRGQNALYRAAHRGHADVVRLLMREGGRCVEVAARGEDLAGDECMVYVTCMRVHDAAC